MTFLLLGCTGVSEKNDTANGTNITFHENETPDGFLPPDIEPVTQIWCNDSDGNDVTTAGVVVSNNRSYEDFCVNNVQIKEYYCQGNLSKSDIINCPTDYLCKNGKCEKKAKQCEDSDGGKNIYQEGMVTLGSLGMSGTYIDKCVEESWVKEYWCENDEMKVEDMKCPEPTHCVNGFCREDACFDSDDGSIYKKGAANKGSEKKTDYCTGTKSGIEYYCDGNQIASTLFTCSDGICVNGACE
ncbi:Uncharacterised protein [Candidatus Bilamarchaeum dharawalense]|uniref:Uncharacterized protein n=1 Tax=Candidatus Bilamarchaeum dharawalense TaxID=2885759 RepID=A0A5E4LVD5_9ARCH|nr:Uncharacterised protein [Candidatus Bilamarchaeum dharawalense]